MPKSADLALLQTHSQIRLRLLATSDVHGAILPYDYAAGREAGCFGLARAASLVAELRDAVDGQCLLLDNGDFLQGTPLSDLHDSTETGLPHPVIAAMNSLGYDAAGIGNHEFNFGLDTLRAAVAQAAFPITCANALTHQGAEVEQDETLLPPYVLLDRQIRDSAGTVQHLKIGILAVVPPQIAAWDKFHLAGQITARDMVETAAARVPMLRAAGADLIILLAHAGMDPGPHQPGMENAALSLAQVPGIDAMIAGHSHEVFPQAGAQPAFEGVDHANGTFHGVPTVMPGFRASHLGVIDLLLTQGATGWQVTGHDVRTCPVKPEGGNPVPVHPATVAAVEPCHSATLSRLSEPLGHSTSAIHSYLSQFRSDLPVRLVAEAQRRAVADALSHGPYAALPVLSATAPFNTGGRAGPDAYTDIPAGPLTLRNIIDLQPFPNTLCALLVTGAEIRDWLERSVSCYFQIQPGLMNQPLWNPAFPGHAADMIAGLRYRIDLTQAPLYTEKGHPTGARRGRIQSMDHRGKPVTDNTRFVMAVNNYRAFGGGPYAALPQDRIIYTSTRAVRDVLADFVRSGDSNRLPLAPTGALLPVPDASALIQTGPGILNHPDEMAALGLTQHDATSDGFLRLCMPLSSGACESAV